MAILFIILGVLYIVGCCILYRHAKMHDRNAVRWTVASIVFSPILVWIAYGLTWPKKPY